MRVAFWALVAVLAILVFSSFFHVLLLAGGAVAIFALGAAYGRGSAALNRRRAARRVDDVAAKRALRP